MHNLYQLSLKVAADPETPVFDPNAMVDKGQALAVALLSMILIVISLMTAFTIGIRGNPGKAAAVVVSVLICLVPAGIGLNYSMKAFLPGLTGWLF